MQRTRGPSEYLRMTAPGCFIVPSQSVTVRRMTAGLSSAIELHNVGVLRDGRWILHDINWSIPAGTCCAILGPNGSGKSTLTRILAGHLWPTVGDVRVL